MSVSPPPHTHRFIKNLTPAEGSEDGVFVCYRVEQVAKAFLFLVKDESVNGAALVVKSNGVASVTFPKDVETTPICL